MKKLLPGMMALVLALAFVGCGKAETTESTPVASSSEVVASSEASSVAESTEESTEESSEEIVETAAGMTYAEYVAAELQSEVDVVMYVQAHQSWWDNKVTVYAADADGAYFIYEMACSEEDAAKLVPGAKILVHGFKAEWAGEVEITDATFEFVEDGDSFIAEAKDVTAMVGTDEIAAYMNQLVSFQDMTVEAVSYKNYQPGDDIYVTLSKDGVNVEFCLEYYLNGSDEELYNTVGNLEVGSTVDVTGFLYWYEGPDAHITAVTVK